MLTGLAKSTDHPSTGSQQQTAALSVLFHGEAHAAVRQAHLLVLLARTAVRVLLLGQANGFCLSLCPMAFSCNGSQNASSCQNRPTCKRPQIPSNIDPKVLESSIISCYNTSNVDGVLGKAQGVDTAALTLIILQTSTPYRFSTGWDEQQIQEGYGTGGTVSWAL